MSSNRTFTAPMEPRRLAWYFWGSKKRAPAIQADESASQKKCYGFTSQMVSNIDPLMLVDDVLAQQGITTILLRQEGGLRRYCHPSAVKNEKDWSTLRASNFCREETPFSLLLEMAIICPDGDFLIFSSLDWLLGKLKELHAFSFQKSCVSFKSPLRYHHRTLSSSLSGSTT